jgi:hypothetical protein
MKAHYRVYVIGHLPPDLRERIASLHASALLKQKNENMPVNTQGLDDKIGKAEHSTIDKVRR